MSWFKEGKFILTHERDQQQAPFFGRGAKRLRGGSCNPAGQSYVDRVMLGFLTTRFRFVILLLAFALGLAGQVASNGAMAAPMQAAMDSGMATGMNCPGCPSDHDSGMTDSCSVAACWSIPALPAQSATARSRSQTVFIRSGEPIITGIATAPDPYPPRSFLQA